MPTYEYCCVKCDYHFEIFQKISEKPVSVCPKCGGSTKRLISSTSFTLKGSGWYKDGYASGGKAKPEKKEEKKKN